MKGFDGYCSTFHVLCQPYVFVRCQSTRLCHAQRSARHSKVWRSVQRANGLRSLLDLNFNHPSALTVYLSVWVCWFCGCSSGETILAIRAPSGTTLEVPDPDEGLHGTGKRRFQIFLRSQDGAVSTFLVSSVARDESQPMPSNPVGTKHVNANF